MSDPAEYDAVIIGAGLSGLAAGIRLAYYDRRVCILERHTTIGGLNSFYRVGGRNYDVGLHAVTNFTPKGTKRGPLALLLRQLRFSWDEFGLVPQIGSRIAFPGVSLEFSNDLELLQSEIARKFPGQVDNFRQLVGKIADYDDLESLAAGPSAREVMAQTISDPLLVEMLLCPIFFYGAASERDLEFGQFCIMFRSIYCEGFARPLEGIRLILKKLVRKFKDLGGELRLRAGVNRISVKDGRACEIVLDDGSVVVGRTVLSSAGWLETMRLCDDTSQADPGRAGQLSFIESLSALERGPAAIGPRPHDRVLQRQRPVPLGKARRTGRPAQRRDLFAQQLPLRRAAGRGGDADHGPGQFRSLGGTAGARIPAGQTALVRRDDRLGGPFRA